MLIRFLKVLFYPLLWLLFPTIYKGKGNIPKGRAIFICNHTSNFDSLLIEMSCWKGKYYLAKKELFKKGFKGWLIKQMNTIPIERGKTDLTAIKTVLKILNNEKGLVIFPEGTRNKTSEVLGEVKAGAAMFAIKAKAPIVPVWIKRKPKIFRFNVLRYGRPFSLEEFYDKKLDSETLENAGKMIAEKLLKNKI